MGIYANKVFPWLLDVTEPKEMAEQRHLILRKVVISDVLCTVKDVDKVLREAYRVLKPAGRLHFLEHGLAKEENIRKWQIRLNGLSKVIACGCELTRDLEGYIQNSSFIIDELVNVSPFSGMNVLYTHIRGIAIKPA